MKTYVRLQLENLRDEKDTAEDGNDDVSVFEGASYCLETLTFHGGCSFGL